MLSFSVASGGGSHVTVVSVSKSALKFTNTSALDINSLTTPLCAYPGTPGTGQDVTLSVPVNLLLPQTEFEFNSLTFSNNSFITFSGDGSFIYFGSNLPQFMPGGNFSVPCNTTPSTTTESTVATTTTIESTATHTTHATSTTHESKSSPTAAASSSSAGAAVGAAVGAVGGVVLFVIVVLVLLKRRARPSTSDMAPAKASSSSLDAAEVKPAHVNVKETISQSFAGTVYHGEFKDGPSKMNVAVRVPLQGASKDIRKQFLKEIALVRRVGLHPYIVECGMACVCFYLTCRSFIGQCTRAQPCMLLLEFCANGSHQ